MATGVQMQQRRASEAVWATSAYVLAPGELGVTTDTGIIKIGNGTSTWSDLDPAFDSHYLPVLGKAADSELLDGIDSTGFWKIADATTAATADKLVKRLSDGRAKGATATASDDLATFGQLTTTNNNVATNTSDITSLKVQSVADQTALLAISTGSLRYGYLVRQTDKGYLWMWDLTSWRYVGTPSTDHPWCRITRGSMTWGNVNGKVWGYSLGENQETNFFSWTAGTSTSAGGGITVTYNGRYRIMSYAATTHTGAYYMQSKHVFPSISSSYMLSKLSDINGAGIVVGDADFFCIDEGYLSAGQKVEHNLNCNTSSVVLNSAQLMVQRVSSI